MQARVTPLLPTRLVVLLATIITLATLQVFEAAILHQQPATAAAVEEEAQLYYKPNTSNTSREEEQQPAQQPSPPQQLSGSQQQESSAQRPAPSTKFLILTTGDQLKLYPFEVADVAGSQQVKLASSYYLLKTSFDVPAVYSDPNSPINQLGNSSFARWVAERAAAASLAATTTTRSRQSPPLRHQGASRSILPSRHSYDIGDQSYSGQSGWSKPWIADVDYLFDPDFCSGQVRTRNCLVVVWLDKSNKFVRYGSLDLSKSPIESFARPSSSSSSPKNRILWLREFPPIELYRRVELRVANGSDTLPSSGQVFAMAVDKRRSLLHVALSDGSQPHPNKILSGRLRASAHVATGASQQLADERLRSFNYCPGRKQLEANEASFENLNIDENNGNWLFYFDKHAGGEIFALSLEGDMQYLPSFAAQALVRDTVLTVDGDYCNSNDGDNADNSADELGAAARWPSSSGSGNEYGNINGDDDQLARLALQQKHSNATGMAMDSKRRKLYWLNEANELFSCSYAGLEARLVGRLSAKPALRSPNAMQVFQDTLYISDPIKKSLIAYKLPTYDGDTIQRNSGVVVDISGSKQMRPTHQVLLVEMPTLYGFRFVDIDALETTAEASIISYDQDFTTDGNNNDAQEGGPTKRVVYASIGVKFLDESTAIEEQAELEADDELQLHQYEKHLLDRVVSGNSLLCGYDQSDYERRMQSKHDESWILLLELGVIHLALLIWFVYPCLSAKLFRSKTSDASLAKEIPSVNSKDSASAILKFELGPS